MIADSIPWKEELLRAASRLEKKKYQVRWTEQSSFLVERDIMVSAYAIRRLIEAWKVSDRLVDQCLDIRQHALRHERVPDFWNRYSYWELFDCDHYSTVQMPLLSVCNQIIHSWMWSLSADEENNLFDGIYVSSDRKRSSVLYFVHVDQLIGTFYAVGSEDVHKVMKRGEDGQYYPENITAIQEQF